MEYRHLGASGLMVSELAYGNWLTHGSQIDADAAKACVHAALDVGITTFDTADTYVFGGAESILGEALAGVRRESYVLCTKVYRPTGDGPNDRGLSRKHIIEGCDASLKRLRTDHIDVYQAHRYDVETPLEETMRAFDDLVRQGKVHYIGVSEWTASQIAEALNMAADLRLTRIVSNQPQYNLLWRVIEPEVVPISRREGIGQIVFSPLAQGILTGKYLPGQRAPAGSRADNERGLRFISRWLTDDVLSRVQELQNIADDAGLPLPVMSLAWVLQNPVVSTAIIGASRPEQVRANARASGVQLDAETMKRIDEVLDPIVERDPGKSQQLEKRP